jgi:hypothetical protein
LEAMNPPALAGNRRDESGALGGVPRPPKLLLDPNGREFSRLPPTWSAVDRDPARGWGITTPADGTFRTSMRRSLTASPPVGRSDSAQT